MECSGDFDDSKFSVATDKAEDKEVVPAATEMVEEQNAETPRDRRRLKRKVLKKRHYKDEKGFLVTEDAYEWESYSEDETNEPVLKRKAPPTSPAKNESKKSAKKGGAADQKSLLSFWGKK
jgi:DNA polymerase delta subunit 3